MTHIITALLARAQRVDYIAAGRKECAVRGSTRR